MTSNLAATAVWKVKENIATLTEIAEAIADKQDKSSVLFLTLQRLSKVGVGLEGGEDVLKEMFDSSGIKLMDHMAIQDCNDARLAEILVDYELSFLMPLLAIRQDMAKQMVKNPGNADGLAKWIGQNVPTKFHSQPNFVVALFCVVFDHIVSSSTLQEQQPDFDKTAQPEKSLIETERELVSKYSVVLRPFVASNASLQLIAVYALQVFTHNLAFPKGMLLRSFVNCYELDIIDEHAFLQWKEDVNDEYPGKGKALFQVRLQSSHLYIFTILAF